MLLPEHLGPASVGSWVPDEATAAYCSVSSIRSLFFGSTVTVELLTWLQHCIHFSIFSIFSAWTVLRNGQALTRGSANYGRTLYLYWGLCLCQSIRKEALKKTVSYSTWKLQILLSLAQSKSMFFRCSLDPRLPKWDSQLCASFCLTFWSRLPKADDISQADFSSPWVLLASVWQLLAWQ